MTNISKAEWRKQLLAKRKSLSADEVVDRSARVCGKLASVSLAAPSTIATYFPIHNEVNILPYVKQLWANGYAVALPIVSEAERILQFAAYAPNTKLVKAAFGVSVPEEKNWVVPQVVLVPLVGFTRAGARLGYGGGYYDVTLAALRAKNKNLLAIGVAFDFQEMDELPNEPHDQTLDMIATESEVILCR